MMVIGPAQELTNDAAAFWATPFRRRRRLLAARRARRSFTADELGGCGDPQAVGEHRQGELEMVVDDGGGSCRRSTR